MPEQGSTEQRETIIDVRELTKAFDESPLFERIHFKIFKGSFTTILGLNGVGKSTLLNILCTRVQADHAEGVVMGHPIGHDMGNARASIGLVSEHLNYELGASAREFSRYYAKLFPEFDTETFRHYCEVRKLDLAKHYSQFSRGQKMQFSLILAMAQRPRVLFIDEITSVLDYKAREFFLQELTKFCHEGGTVVLTTNIINEVQQYSTDLVVIRNSEEVLWGQQAEILSRFVKLRLRDLSALPAELRESALYLGRDPEFYHLLLTSLRDWQDAVVEKRDEVQCQSANLHEVFSWLTQQT